MACKRGRWRERERVWRTHAGPAAATAEGDARLVSLAGAGLPKVQKILVVAAKRDQAGMLSCLLF